ncbi:MAG: carbamoyltransferase, partial [Armatimonadetes bacterium]|nr:carbamoyltransferase [Armatimonadota bacterium]
RLLGLEPRKGTEDLSEPYYDLAASAQAVFEKRLLQLLAFFSRKIGAPQLAASGGCFMNSLANGKIIPDSPVERIFIPYAAADNGGAMGSALYVWHYVLGNERAPAAVTPSPYLGPEYSDSEIESCLAKYKLPFKKIESIAQYAARQVASGKLLGWFQGRMEFGERALGNRSIIADPRDPEMKEKINSAVKYREPFRPFAPSILSERTSEYFMIPDKAFVPYMEQVYPFKDEKKKLVPAVVHNDGTGRLQMVTRGQSPLFYELIGEFEKLTGIPIVLNTSFNVQGEPIVCSPTDALRTFYSCGLDVLIMDKFVLEK